MARKPDETGNGANVGYEALCITIPQSGLQRADEVIQ